IRSEKTDETPIWEAKPQVWREHSLQRPANPPEVRHFEPALTSNPHRRDHNDHAPIAHLHRQHLPPIEDAVAANKNKISDIIEHEHCRENSDYRVFNPR